MTITTSPARAPGPAASVDRSQVRLSPPRTARRVALQLVGVVLAMAALWSFVEIGANPLTLWFERDDVLNLLERMWPPRIEHPGNVLDKALDTFFMAFVGTAIGFALALPLGFLAASNVTTSRVLRTSARAVIVGTRALPDLVLALLFVRAYSIGVLPGILALGIHSVGMLGKLFADSIEQIDARPRDGVAATGAGRFQELSTGVLPQIVPSFIAISLYRLDINFRSATLLGLVGAGGIGLDIRAHQGSLDYQQLLGVTLVIIAMIVVVELVSTRVRSVILGHDRTRPGTVARWTHRPSAEPFRPEGDHASRATGGSPPAGARLTPPWTTERITMYLFVAVCAVLLVLSFVLTDVSLVEFVTGLPEIPRIFWRLVPNDMSWWQPMFATQLVETVEMGLAATLLALVVALPTAFLAARNVAPARWIYAATRTFILGVRALPDLIVAVIFVAALGLGPRPGVLALAIGLFGFATKLFADSIEEVSEPPRDGIRSTGASGVQESFAGVATQAFPAIVGNSLYLLDVSIRSSTVLGIVGAGGIGFSLIQSSKLLQWDTIGGLLICVFLIVSAIELLSTWIRDRLL